MDSRPLILIADDEKPVHMALTAYLRNENFDCISAYDGMEALNLYNQHKPDLIILDMMMPKMNGQDVCRTLRATETVPIVMLTAKGEEVDRILGLEMGADDYIVKPFSPREVVARIKAIFRRINEVKRQDQRQDLHFNGLDIKIESYEVLVDGQVVNFTPKEVDILYLLASNPGQVFSRENILNTIWGYDFFGDSRTVDTHIKRIRQKIKCEEHDYRLITIYSVGYKFEANHLVQAQSR